MKRLLAQFALACPLAVSAVIPAFAQDPGFAARVEAVQARYETAAVAGDAAAFTALFADEAIYMPIYGGTYVGMEAIQDFAAVMPRPAALDIRSTGWQRTGDLVIDYGTFSVTLPAQAGGAELLGEYVAVVQDLDGELKLLQLATFPPRGN